MSKVDNRIVELQFNNKQFEKGVQTSLESLKGLDKTLAATGDAKALAGLQQGLDTITSRFSTLGIVGMTTMQEITRSVISSAKRITSTLVGMVTTGGKNRALNIEQAKFQFKGLGMDVEQAMEDALYAVKGTAYGLDEAAKAASQLGASGLALGDDMKGALRAISGVAAMTNSSYDDISRIFINVSGNGRLMGQQLLSLSGRGINAAAVLAESMGKSEEAVRKMVTAGEIDFETFYQAMDKAFGEHATAANETYAGSLSNVKAALSRVGAGLQTEHLNDMRDLFNGLIPVIDALYDQLEPFIKLFNEFRRGIVDNVLASLKEVDLRPIEPALLTIRNSFVALLKVTDPIREAFKDIFPPKTSEEILAIANSINDFTEKLFISDKTSDNLKRTFKGLFAIVDIGVDVIFAMVRAFGSLIGFTVPIGTSFLEVTAAIGDFLVAVRDAVKESKIINRVFEGLVGVIRPIAKVITDTVESIIQAFKRFGKEDTSEVKAYGEEVEKSFKPFTLIAEVVVKAVELISKSVEKVAPLFIALGSGVGKGLAIIQDKITGFMKSLDFGKGLNLFNSGMFAVVLLGLKKFIGKLSDFTQDGKNIITNIKGIFGGVTDMMVSMQQNVKAKTIVTIAAALGLLSVSIMMLASVDSGKLGAALLAITTLMVTLFGTFSMFEKLMAGSGFKSIMKVSASMVLLSTAVLVLSLALKKLADLNWNQLLKGLVGVGGMMTMLVVASKALSSTSGRLMKGAAGFIFFAVALNVLTKAVRKLGEMDTGDMIQGLLGVGGLLTGLGLFMNTVDLDGMGVAKGVGILAFAVALTVMSKAVKMLGELDTNDMIQGLFGLGGVLLAINLFLKTTGDSSKVMSTAVGLTILAGAMVIMSSAVQRFGQMDSVELVKGLLAMASALTIITVALNFVQGAIGGAAAIIVVSAALAILAPVLMILGSMSMSEIGKGLLVIAGTFTILGVAGLTLAPIVPVILSLGGAIALLGAGVALIGGGLMLLATGLGALAVGGTAGVAALVLMITSLIGLIPMFLEQVANGVIAFARVIGEGTPAITAAIVAVIISLADAIIETAPKVSQAAVVLITSILDALIAIAPKVGEGLIKIVTGLIKGMINAVKELLGINSPSTVFKGIGSDVIAGLILGIKSGIKSIIEWGKNIGKNLVNGIKEFLGINSPSTVFKGFGGDVIDGFVNGIKGSIKDVATWAGNIATTVKDGVKNVGSDLWTAGSDAINGFVNGIKDNISKVAEWGKNIGSTVLNSTKNFLGIHSPSRVFMKEVAKPITDGLTKGIKKNTPQVKKASVELGKTTTKGTAKGIKKGTPKVQKQAKKSATKVRKTVYETTKEWIDKQRKYHDLSLEAELSKWKSIQKKYKKGSDERLEIDLRMSNIKKEQQKASFDHSVKWINEEKYYNRLSLKEELDAWLRVQARFKKGSEERKQADREVYRVRNELTAKQKQIDEDYYKTTKDIADKLKEDIKSVTAEYENAVESRAKALSSAYGLFDKVEVSEELITGRELVTNLEDQVRAFDKWQSNLTQLTRRGVDEGLIKELQEMGPKSLEQIRALQSLSDSELIKYVTLWKSKHEQARTQATFELEGMKKDTKTKIKELEDTAKKELNEYKAMWMKESSELSKGVQKEFGNMNKEVTKSVKDLKKETTQEFKSINTEIKAVFENEDWGNIGREIVRGITLGVRKNSHILITEMSTLAKESVKATRKELGIKSPSREFAEVGKFSVLGLAEGFKRFANRAVDGATDVGNQAMLALAETMDDISELIDEKTELSPTVRPVIDLTNINDGLEQAFGDDPLLNSVVSRRRAELVASNQLGNDSIDDIPKNTEEVTIVNNNYEVYATIREEADIDKVSKGLYKLQVKNRRGKGVVVL